MFRKVFPCCCLIFLFFIGSFGYAIEPQLRVGEVLEYKLYAKSAIYGAYEIIKVVSKETYHGRETYRIHSEMTTVGIVKGLYNYTQTEDMIMDAEKFYPYWIRLETHDRSTNQLDEVRFDYDGKKGIRVKTKNDETKTSEFEIPGFVQDGLSLIFYLRQNQIEDLPRKIYFYGNGKIDESTFEIQQISKPMKMEGVTYSKYLQILDKEDSITVLIAEDQGRLPFFVKKIANFGTVDMRLTKVN